MFFILCVHEPLLGFWGAVMLVKHMLFLHVQFLILQNLDFMNLSAIFLYLFLQFPSLNFFFTFGNTIKPTFGLMMNILNLLTRSCNIF